MTDPTPLEPQQRIRVRSVRTVLERLLSALLDADLPVDIHDTHIVTTARDRGSDGCIRLVLKGDKGVQVLYIDVSEEEG